MSPSGRKVGKAKRGGTAGGEAGEAPRRCGGCDCCCCGVRAEAGEGEAFSGDPGPRDIARFTPDVAAAFCVAVAGAAAGAEAEGDRIDRAAAGGAVAGARLVELGEGDRANDDADADAVAGGCVDGEGCECTTDWVPCACACACVGGCKGAGLMMVPKDRGIWLGKCMPAMRGVTLPLPLLPDDPMRATVGGSSGEGDLPGDIAIRSAPLLPGGKSGDGDLPGDMRGDDAIRSMPLPRDDDPVRPTDGGSSGVGDFRGVMCGEGSVATAVKASMRSFSVSAEGAKGSGDICPGTKNAGTGPGGSDVAVPVVDPTDASFGDSLPTYNLSVGGVTMTEATPLD